MVVHRHIVTCSLQKIHVWEKRTWRERVGNVTGKIIKDGLLRTRSKPIIRKWLFIN